MAEHFDRVVVSTDDGEVAAVARQYGAEVIERPAELSGDTALYVSYVSRTNSL